MYRRKFVYFVLFLLNMNLIFSQGMENLSQGEKLFKENKPKEAVQVLENELLNGIVTANTYNFRNIHTKIEICCHLYYNNTYSFHLQLRH